MALHAAHRQQQQQLMLLVGKRNKNKGKKTPFCACNNFCEKKRWGGCCCFSIKSIRRFQRYTQGHCKAQTHRLFLALIARATVRHSPTPATGGANGANVPLAAEDVAWVHQLRLFAILSPYTRCSLCFRERLESSDRCLPHMRS